MLKKTFTITLLLLLSLIKQTTGMFQGKEVVSKLRNISSDLDEIKKMNDEKIIKLDKRIEYTVNRRCEILSDLDTKARFTKRYYVGYGVCNVITFSVGVASLVTSIICLCKYT